MTAKANVVAPSAERPANTVWARALSLSRHHVARNTLVLYFANGLGFLVPVLTTPFLARVLGPSEWGAYAIAQSLAIWSGMVVEYGFMFTATRQVARHVDARPALRRIVANVHGAKALLVVVTTVIALVAWRLTPVLSHRPEYVVWAWVWATAQGFSPLWYFQGRQQMARSALSDGLGRLAGVGAMLMLVRSPSQGPLALAVQAIGVLLGSSAGLVLLYSGLPARRPTLRRSLQALAVGASLFLQRIATSFYTVLNVFLLGLVAAPWVVSCYAGAERITSLAIAGFWPFWRALYPHVVGLLKTDRPRAMRLSRTALLLTAGVGCCIAIFLEIAASHVMTVFLGGGYDESVLVLRLLAPVVPLAGITGACGVLLMVPLGRDRAFSLITVAAAFLNVALALGIVPVAPLVRMPLLVVGIEAFIAIALFWNMRGVRDG